MAGFQNNPLTKFPLSIMPPGSANLGSPSWASFNFGSFMRGLAYSPVGPIAHAPHMTLTPISGRNLGNVHTEITRAIRIK